MDTEIVVNYRQRGEDFVAAAAEGVDRPAWDDEVKRLKDGAFTNLINQTAIGAGVGLLCVEPMVWLGASQYQAAGLRLVAMGIGSVYFGGRALLRFRRVRNRSTLREQLVRDTIAACSVSADEPVTIRVSTDGLEYQGAQRTTRWAWPAIWRLDEFSRWDIVTTYDYRAILVPKDAHPDGEHRRRFLAQLRHHRDSAGGDVTMVVAWLRDHDLACSMCRYPLRGITGAICPECGTPVSFDLVRQAHARALHASDPARAARR